MSETPADALAELEARIRSSEFQRWAGLELVRLERGSVEFALHIAPHHENLVGQLHGGMIATLADTATGVALRTVLDPGFDHVTVQLELHFLAAARGERIVARGKVVRAGRRIGYAEADVVDDEERLIAKASATFLISQREGAEDAN